LAIVFLTLTLISQLLNLVVIGWTIRAFPFFGCRPGRDFSTELRRGLAELGGHRFFLTSENVRRCTTLLRL
jgi:hypothetical protein